MRQWTFALSRDAEQIWSKKSLIWLVCKASTRRTVWFEGPALGYVLVLGVGGRLVKGHWRYEVTLGLINHVNAPVPFNDMPVYGTTPLLEFLLDRCRSKRPWRECWWRPWARWRRVDVKWEEEDL